MSRIKICGITNREDALAACDAGADALGFNFAEEAKKRNRYIEPDAAREIIAELPPFVTTVAVCVNAPQAELEAYLRFVDFVQLHGEESAEDCNALAGRVIKAFRVGPGFDLAGMLAYRAAAFLLDAYVEGARGGTGKVFDWSTAVRAKAFERPLILAGGLTPDNVAEAVRLVQPYAVDVAGGVESAPGKKDHELIRRFIRNARL
jgi:phosphoribosylanthranilate isomerase